MNRSAGWWRTTVGLKVIQALSGAGLMTFLTIHLLGNLRIFLGPDAFNRYAELLASAESLLGIARAGLLFTFLVHITTGICLRWRSAQARPTGYAVDATVQATLASRTMLLTGIIILGFALFHLLHFTYGVIYPGYHGRLDAAHREDVHAMVVLGLGHPWIAGVYGTAVALLALHLRHAFPSGCRTLGVSSPGLSPWLDRLGLAFAAVTGVGFLTIPLAVTLQYLRLPS